MSPSFPRGLRQSLDRPVRCPELSQPAKGLIAYSGDPIVDGVTATVTCDADATLAGPAVLACTDTGAWDASTLPACVPGHRSPHPLLLR